jgi:hypothetical protein
MNVGQRLAYQLMFLTSILAVGAIVEPMKADIAERQNALKAMNEAAPEELRQRVIDFNEQQRPEEKSQAEIAELIDQLEREKVDSQAKLDMTTKVNQSVIQTYEERLAKVCVPNHQADTYLMNAL